MDTYMIMRVACVLRTSGALLSESTVVRVGENKTSFAVSDLPRLLQRLQSKPRVTLAFFGRAKGIPFRRAARNETSSPEGTGDSESSSRFWIPSTQRDPRGRDFPPFLFKEKWEDIIIALLTQRLAFQLGAWLQASHPYGVVSVGCIARMTINGHAGRKEDR